MEKELWEYLKTVKKPIVLYGIGNGADKIINMLNSHKIPLSGVFASDGFVKRKSFHGFTVCSYGELKEIFGEMIVLVSFGTNRSEVIENIDRIALEQELYAPDVPVYGNVLFNYELLKSHRDEIKFVYSLLSDELSKKTFECIINFKLSGKISFLKECQVPLDEPYKTFLKLSNNECFADLGAYNGDTTEEFIMRTKGYSQITAVEPDPKSFRKLLANTEKYKNINYVNACVSNDVATAFFSKNNGRGSGKAESGIEIPQITVDSIFKDREVTLIKADVEGEEKNTVLGMKQTVELYRPKLILACYHRSEDLFSLPIAVNNLRSDYKLYLRRFPSIPAWDMNYYFI